MSVRDMLGEMEESPRYYVRQLVWRELIIAVLTLVTYYNGDASDCRGL